MDDSDVVAILPADVLSDVSSVEEPPGPDFAEEKSRVPARALWGCRRRLPVTVEPVMFLSMFSLTLQGPLVSQYLWDRISEDLGYNGSKAEACTNSSAPPDPLQEEVQTLTAHWSVYINLGGFLVGLLVVPLLGSWSDLAGRRPVLIIPNLGVAVQVGIYLVVMYLKLPVACFLVGRIVCGLTGDFSTILAGCFAYVADVSEKKSLTFRVGVLEASIGLAGMLAGIIGGYWRRAQGYINPFWLSLALSLAAALYSYLFVGESVHTDPSARLLSLRHYKAAWRLYTAGGVGGAAGRPARLRLWLYTLCFFLVVSVHFGRRSLDVLYLLSSPLCWGPELIGFASAAQNLAIISSLLGLKVLQLCLKDAWVALLALASNMVGLVVYGVADTTALVFISYGLGFLFMATTPVVRSKLSKLVEPSEQGALFASIACVESLCLLVGNSLFSALYPATLHLMKGFPFLFAAIVLLVPAGIIGTLQCLDQRRNHREAAVS